MAMTPHRCVPGFSARSASPFSDRLERHTAAMETHYHQSYLELLRSLATLHDAVDSALADDDAASQHLRTGLAELRTSNEELASFGESLVRLRRDLLDSPAVDTSEALIAREPFFASLDYDGLYRELAGERAALPHRVFWDDVASRMRDGGARGGLRLLDRHVRELQTDLCSLIGEVEAIGRLSGRPLGEALHDTSIPIARVLMGYTRLLTTSSYVSFLCERAMLAYERAQQPDAALTLVAS